MSGKSKKVNTRYEIVQTFRSGTNAPIVSVLGNSYSWTDQTFGGSMPSYRKKIRLGYQATTPFYGEKVTIDAEPGLALYEYRTSFAPTGYRFRGQTGHLCKNIGIPDTPLSSSATTAENLAREEFYGKYRGAQTRFQGGTALGEIRETLRMLRNPAKALRSKVGDLYRKLLRNKRKAGRTVNSKNRYLSESWLEGTFGWAPLIDDIKEAYELLDNRAAYLDRNLIVIKADVTRDEEIVDHNAVTFGSGFLNYAISSKETQRCQVRYLGAVDCRASDTSCGDARLWGFTPDNIIPTVWELMPYSFLIDYFTNIGDVIDAWSLRRCSLAWGARTERRLGIRQNVDARSFNSKDPIEVVEILQESFYPGQWRSERKVVDRTPIDSVPLPDLRFKLPGMSTKWINMAALVHIKHRKF